MYQLSSFVQKKMHRESLIFNRMENKQCLLDFENRLKSHQAFLVQKPDPLQATEMVGLAEHATCGSMTAHAGRVAAFIRFLSGPRNPAMVAWTWKHVKFVPVVVKNKETGVEEVRSYVAAPLCMCTAAGPPLVTHVSYQCACRGVPFHKEGVPFGLGVFVLYEL